MSTAEARLERAARVWRAVDVLETRYTDEWLTAQAGVLDAVEEWLEDRDSTEVVSVPSSGAYNDE